MPAPASHDLFDLMTDTLRNALQRGTTDFGSLNNIIKDFGFELYQVQHTEDSDYYTIIAQKKITLYAPQD